MSTKYFNSLPADYQLGKFRIDSVLGEGGFGITYKALDTVLRQTRAIKEYLPGEFAVRGEGSVVRAKSSDQEENFAWGIKRFLMEAQTLARFDHPNIVRVLDLFERNDTAYMVMVYYAGDSLQQRIREHRVAQTEEQLLSFVRPLLHGLAVVHEKEILHLDIKPANIYIRHDTQAPVLLDFGAAKELISQHSHSMGSVYTPGYAAFEQYHQTGRRGPWTDIYGLGATLYHMVVGTPLQEAPGRLENDIVVPAVEAGRDRYTPEFLAAIDAAIRVFGKDRPQTCQEWEVMLASGERSSIPVRTQEAFEERGEEAPDHTIRVPSGPSRAEMSARESTPADPVHDPATIVSSPGVLSVEPALEETPAMEDRTIMKPRVSAPASQSVVEDRRMGSVPGPASAARPQVSADWHSEPDAPEKPSAPSRPDARAERSERDRPEARVERSEKDRPDDRRSPVSPPASRSRLGIEDDWRNDGSGARSRFDDLDRRLPDGAPSGPIREEDDDYPQPSREVPATGGRSSDWRVPDSRPRSRRDGPDNDSSRPSLRDRSEDDSPRPSHRDRSDDDSSRPSRRDEPRSQPGRRDSVPSARRREQRAAESRVEASAMAAPARSVTLAGWLVAANGLAAGLHAINPFSAPFLQSADVLSIGGTVAPLALVASGLGFATWLLFEFGAPLVAKPRSLSR